MPIPIIVLTNGRPECISKTIPSVVEHLHGAGCRADRGRLG